MRPYGERLGRMTYWLCYSNPGAKQEQRVHENERLSPALSYYGWFRKTNRDGVTSMTHAYRRQKATNRRAQVQAERGRVRAEMAEMRRDYNTDAGAADNEYEEFLLWQIHQNEYSTSISDYNEMMKRQLADEAYDRDYQHQLILGMLREEEREEDSRERRYGEEYAFDLDFDDCG